jgi:AraC-like DNA-binding protein
MYRAMPDAPSARLDRLLAQPLPTRVRANAATPAPPRDEAVHPITDFRLIIVLEGRKEEIFADGEAVVRWQMVPGEALLLRPGTWLMPRFHSRHRHLGIVRNANQLRIAWCRCDGHAGRAQPLAFEESINVPMPVRSALAQTCDSLLALVVNAEPAAARHLVAALLLQVHAACLRPQVPESKGQRTWRALMHYVIDNCLFPVGRDDAAKALGVTPNYVSLLCRRHGNHSFVELLTERRLERAAAILRSVDLPIGQVARSCGFADAGYFIKRFRHAYGVTPGNYRVARGK